MSAQHEHDGHGHRHAHGDGHAHAHGHSHSHAHAHAVEGFGRRFAIGIALQSAFVVAEVLVGLAAHSLALLADAGHNVSDVLALALAWGASHLGKRGASKGRTYGMKSASILAAMANSLMLVFVNGGVVWEAIGRLRVPQPVDALPMVAVATAGVVVNGVSAWLFAKGSEEDVNVRAAFLHLASDAAVAGGVAITGVAIHFTGIVWLDPAASVVVSMVVLYSTWSLLRRAIDLAMHAVPRGIDEDKVRAHLEAVRDVVSVHDLHIWAISTTETALSAHLVLRAIPTGAFACDLDEKLRSEFAIHHVTLQIEPEGSSCALAGEGAV